MRESHYTAFNTKCKSEMTNPTKFYLTENGKDGIIPFVTFCNLWMEPRMSQETTKPERLRSRRRGGDDNFIKPRSDAGMQRARRDGGDDGKAEAPAEKRRSGRFPESENAFVQMLLFLRGGLPAVGALFREKVLRRKKRSARSGARVRGWMEELSIHPLAFLLGAMVVAAAAVALSMYTIGTAVAYNGIDLGVVPGRSTVDKSVVAIQTATRRALGDNEYELDASKLDVRRKLVARREVQDRDTFQARLTDAVGVIDYGYVLYVDDEPVAATHYPGALEELLEQMKIGYVTKNTVESYFVENVEVREEYVNRTYMMNLGYVAEKLYSTKSAEITYTVKDGDTYYDIANEYDLTLAQLLNMNPGYDAMSLHTGDVLTVSQAVPYLTVVDVERQSYVQDVPYGLQYQDDPDMYQGDYEVLSSGVYGKADITANVTYVNGEEKGRQVVATATLAQPVDEVRLRGTKERPSWFPTGVFRWPCSGVITSYFGGRYTGISGASTYHEGIDIANRYGTVIYASDGGTVTHSGWFGGYGYLIIIDHGNGYETYYGHCSSLFVSVGEHVYQGQAIAYMGATGVASGTHCHFSIVRNGTFVDPLNYLT